MTWEQYCKSITAKERFDLRAFAYDIEQAPLHHSEKTKLLNNKKVKLLMPLCGGAAKDDKNVFCLQPQENDYYAHWEIVKYDTYQEGKLNFVTFDKAMQFLTENELIVKRYYNYFNAISVTFKSHNGTIERKYI